MSRLGMDKIDIQRKYADHFRALGFDIPFDECLGNGNFVECNYETCSLSLEDIIRAVMATSIDLVPSHSATVYMYDRKSRMLVAKASTNAKRELDVKFAPAMGIVGRCFSRKVVVNLEQPGRDPLFEAKSDGKVNKQAESMLCVPFILEDKAIGLLQLVNRIGKKRDKLQELDRYSEGFDTLKFTADHQHEVNENAFGANDIACLVEYLALVVPSLVNCIRRLDATNSVNKSGDNSGALDLINLLNGTLMSDDYEDNNPEPQEDTPEIVVVRKPRPPSKRRPPRLEHSFSFPKPTINMRETFVKAAVKCQSCGRGWLVRRQRILDKLRLERAAREEIRKAAACCIQRAFRDMRRRSQYNRKLWARSRICSAILQYISRHRGDLALPMLQEGSTLTRQVWDQTYKALLKEHAKRKHGRVTKIQKIYRGHKARTQVKKHYGASNPARIFRGFIKFQARFKGGLVRNLIQKHTIMHMTAQSNPTQRNYGIVQLKTDRRPAPSPRQLYPVSHTGANPYVVAHRGQIAHVGHLFDAHRSNTPVSKKTFPPIQNPEKVMELSSRRLVGVPSQPSSQQLPQLDRYSSTRRAVKTRDKSSPRPFPYHLDPVQHRSTKHAMSRSPCPPTNRHAFDIKQYPQYRTRSFYAAVGAVPPSPRLRPPPPSQAFLCLAQYTRDVRREGVRSALEELKRLSRARITQPTPTPRKSIKQIIEECRSIATTSPSSLPPVNVPLRRVSNPLNVPETIEDSLEEMDSVDSLALEYRPVTPMLEAIELIPPEPPFTELPLDLALEESSSSVTLFPQLTD
ncbi:hypothetical protein AeMF1_021773 [Aphanomyces euteiches]|nr:hypothetical protein AeMF1_021773 [Aphanomyces euteiches]KAH9192477.1 hypothetical protein AeNC1_005543 [Aphanomyces euteiches]